MSILLELVVLKLGAKTTECNQWNMSHHPWAAKYMQNALFKIKCLFCRDMVVFTWQRTLSFCRHETFTVKQ